MKPDHILLIEAYTDANIGSGALIENSVRLLRERFPDAEIRVMAHNIEGAANVTDAECVPDFFLFPFNQARWKQCVWLITTFCWMIPAWLFPKFASWFHSGLAHIQWTDIVVSIGAERINDKYVKNVIFSLYTYSLVKRMKKKMVIFPSTIGPFLYQWTRKLTARIFRKLDLIYVRDQRSYNETVSLSGIDVNRVINTVDVAVFQSWKDNTRELLPVKTEKQIVGISAIRWTYVANKYDTPFSNYDAYVREMAKFTDMIIEKYGVHVVLYPTNFPVHGCREDDVVVAKEIYEKLNCKECVTCLESLPTPYEFKSMLSCSEVNITTRMHACILSTGAAIPTISVNYLFKIAEYMESLGLKDFSIDIEDFNSDIALDVFGKIWANRSEWKEHIRQKIIEKQDNLNSALEKMYAFHD